MLPPVMYAGGCNCIMTGTASCRAPAGGE